MWMLLACTNSMRAVDGAPFDLERVQNATVTQTADSDPEAGVGFADVLVSSQLLTCGEPAPTDGSTVELRLRWVHEAFDNDDSALDQGWEGVYRQAQPMSEAVDQGAVSRSFFTSVTVDGERWDLEQFPGTVEVLEYGDEVTGTVDHQWVKGRFTATHCGQAGPDDTGAP